MLSLSDNFLVASNLKNNGPLMPHFILQLLQTLLPSLKLNSNSSSSNILVSIYESGSTDDTAAWLKILDKLLKATGERRGVVWLWRWRLCSSRGDTLGNGAG